MSLHFSMYEMTYSETAMKLGIDNTPSELIKKQLEVTMAGLERIRAALKYPLKITSGYRCEALNIAVGGSVNSQHLQGLAADFKCPVIGDPRTVAAFLSGKMEMLGIDQLIREHTWVHVSFTLNPRHEVLTYKEGRYIPGIVG